MTYSIFEDVPLDISRRTVKVSVVRIGKNKYRDVYYDKNERPIFSKEYNKLTVFSPQRMGNGRSGHVVIPKTEKNKKALGDDFTEVHIPSIHNEIAKQMKDKVTDKMKWNTHFYLQENYGIFFKEYKPKKVVKRLKKALDSIQNTFIEYKNTIFGKNEDQE